MWHGRIEDMDDFSDDHIFLNAVDAVVVDALTRIGNVRAHGTRSSGGF